MSTDTLWIMGERADDGRTTALAFAAGRGDRGALAEFVRATQRDVHRFLVHLAGPLDAEDLAQETYLRALRALPRFAGHASARTWLLAIARHVAADAVRSAVRRPRTSDVENWDTATSGRSRPPADEAVMLRLLIEALDTDRRAAFVLTQLLGLGYEEAAEVCGCPVGTIRSRVARARADLVSACDERGRRAL